MASEKSQVMAFRGISQMIKSQFRQKKMKVKLEAEKYIEIMVVNRCLLYTSPSPRDVEESRMPSSA